MEDPVERRRHRTPPAERGNPIGGAGKLAICFAMPEKTGHPLSRYYSDVLDLQVYEFVNAKATPETQKKHGSITTVAKPVAAIAAKVGGEDGVIQPIGDRAHSFKLQRFGTFFARRMERLNALQRLFDNRCRRGIGKAMRFMPVGESRQPLP